MKQKVGAVHADDSASQRSLKHKKTPVIQVGWGSRADERSREHGRPDFMTAHQHPPHSGGPSRRTQIVFATFALSMTLVMGLLALDTPSSAGGFPLTTITPLDDQSNPNGDQLFATSEPLAADRWTGIVIHHLGDHFGTAESVHRQHLSWGYQGLGYHFLIGNGNGLGNGEVHVGYRWIEQLPGAHVVGPEGRSHNNQSIGICLIGDGDRQAFSERQIRHLARLVQRLQRQFGIAAADVRLHRDLANGITSPGVRFPEADFHGQLLNPTD